MTEQEKRYWISSERPPASQQKATGNLDHRTQLTTRGLFTEEEFHEYFGTDDAMDDAMCLPTTSQQGYPINIFLSGVLAYESQNSHQERLVRQLLQLEGRTDPGGQTVADYAKSYGEMSLDAVEALLLTAEGGLPAWQVNWEKMAGRVKNKGLDSRDYMAPTILAKRRADSPGVWVKAEITLPGQEESQIIDMLLDSGQKTSLISRNDARQAGWNEQGPQTEVEIHLLDELGERVNAGARRASVSPEEEYTDGAISILGKDLLHGMLVITEPDRNKPPELPGVPMPEKYGTTITGRMELPPQQCAGDGNRQTKVELTRDGHGQAFICFLTWENEQYEQWLMTPVRPAVLERAAESTGMNLKSAVANADFMLAQNISKSNMLDVQTNITALNAMPDAEAEEIFENIIPDCLEVAEDLLKDWLEMNK